MSALIGLGQKPTHQINCKRQTRRRPARGWPGRFRRPTATSEKPDYLKLDILSGISAGLVALRILSTDFMTETRKLAAILAADVVGYSRLACMDEDRILAAWYRPLVGSPRMEAADANDNPTPRIDGRPWRGSALSSFPTASMSANPPRTARSASSSWACGYPKNTSTPSPMYFATNPPTRCTVGPLHTRCHHVPLL
jgi:hypothetical protein